METVVFFSTRGWIFQVFQRSNFSAAVAAVIRQIIFLGCNSHLFSTFVTDANNEIDMKVAALKMLEDIMEFMSTCLCLKRVN